MAHDCSKASRNDSPYRKGPALSANCAERGRVYVGKDGRDYRAVGGVSAGGRAYQRWVALPGQARSTVPSRPHRAPARARPAPKPTPKAKPKARPKAKPKARPKAKPKPRSKPKARARARAKPRPRAR